MTGVILGIIGIVLTAAFGIYAILFNRKNRKKKISLEFKKVQCYSLFKNDIARLNIEISYNNKILSNALILLKARIINNGYSDIDKNRVHQPLRLKSQPEFVWVDAKSITEPNGSKVKVQIINENEIQIDWDLLKSEEFVEFEAIVKVSDSLPMNIEETFAFINGITFDYRITDLNSIHREKEGFKTTKNIRRFSVIYAISVIIFGVFMLNAEFFPNLSIVPKKIDFIICSDSTKITGNIITKNNEEISLSSEKFTNDKILSINNFNKAFKIDSIEKISISKKDLWFIRITGIVFIIMGSLLLYAEIYIEKKRKKKLTNASA